MLLVDLFAYVGDVMLYYQDRIANESFLHTATERRSVLQMLRLIGYELKPPVAAAADLNLLFKPVPAEGSSLVVIPQGAQFVASSASGPQTFEYVGADLRIDLSSAQVQLVDGGKLLYSGLPVRQSRTLPTEVLGSSTGEANQSFPLRQSPLILESLLVEVNEGAGWVAWDRRQDLLYYVGADGRVTVAGPESRDYYVRYDENDGAMVHFGDGVYGARPPAGSNNIRATYRVGGGTVGNVPVGAINQPAQVVRTALPLLDSVTNPVAAAGGADRESIDHATRFGPLAFRSGQRAVTLADFESLAQQIGGVAKVRGVSRDWNHVDLYIAPESGACGPVPEDLRLRIIAAFEDKRMVTSIIRVLDATCVPIDITMDVLFDRHFRVDAVRQSVDAAVRNLLAFNKVDFSLPVYLSSVYGAVEVLPGVTALTVTRFGRHTSLEAGGAPIDIGIGRIDIGDFEIPTLGELTINMLETGR
jgi:predicted phage baseplate assembly protein